MSERPALALRGAGVRLEGRQILSGVDLLLVPGRFTALVGPNGAGKSTLIKAALGLMPSTGEVELGGTPLSRLGPAERARRAAWLPQDKTAAWSITGADLAALGRFAWGGGRAYARLSEEDRTAVDRALSRADAAHLKDRPVTALSGGERARLHLARALAAEAPLLLADEPGAALDPRHQLDAMAVLRAEAESGAAVLAALHDLALAERFADRIVVLDEGRLITDAPASEALTDAILADVFHVKRREAGGFEGV
ncbi:MAG: ABC transporter ATP-binding protein [Oceanicaulis sp.]